MFLNKLIQSTIITTSLLALSAPALADCLVDSMEMKIQIQQWDSITTRNGYQIQEISNVTNSGNNFCKATGFSFNYPVSLSWMMSNWGKTLYANR